MLVYEYEGYRKKENEGCFAIGENREEIHNDLECFCKVHNERTICYYEHPFKCVMEIRIADDDEDVYDSYFWKVAQRNKR